MATVSISQERYVVGEIEMAVNVSVLCSGNSESHVVVLIASDPNKGSARGQVFHISIPFLHRIQSLPGVLV